MYPPSAAAMLGLLSPLGATGMLIALVAVTSASWIACIALSIWLVAGPGGRRHPLVVIVPTLSVIVLIHNIYLLGQPNLMLLALLLGAFACLRLGREVAAGALVATAAAIKAFPILVLAYLVYRRMWKASIATVVVLAAWLLDRALAVPDARAGRGRPVGLDPRDALHLQLARHRTAAAAVVQLQEPVDHGRDAPAAAGRAGRWRVGPVGAVAARAGHRAAGEGAAAGGSVHRPALVPEAAPPRGRGRRRSAGAADRRADGRAGPALGRGHPARRAGVPRRPGR